MLFLGIIAGFFGAIAITIALWILCAFSGRFVNPHFRMKALLHFLCFVVAVPTLVLLIVVFTCNNAIRTVAKIETIVCKLLIDDEKFVDGLNGEIVQTSTTKDTGKLTDYIAGNFFDRITSNYPIVSKYVNVKKIMKNSDLSRQLIDAISNGDSGIVISQKLIQVVVKSITFSIRSKIKSVRRTSLFAVLLLQAIAFGTVFYRASRYRSPIRPNYHYESNDNRV